MQTDTFLDGIERTSQLDGAADLLLDRVGKTFANGPYGDLLKGKWLGHPLHPLLTDIPIGFWTSGMMLDFLSPKQSRKAAGRASSASAQSARSRLHWRGSPARFGHRRSRRTTSRGSACRRQHHGDRDVRPVMARSAQGP